MEKKAREELNLRGVAVPLKATVSDVVSGSVSGSDTALGPAINRPRRRLSSQLPEGDEQRSNAIASAGVPAGMNQGRVRKARTRIQREKRAVIFDAALDAFSRNGFRGTTIDDIAELAGMSKPNLLYYFENKQDIHKQLLADTLEAWFAPLGEIDPRGEPMEEIAGYIERKMEMTRLYPRESRMFANEMISGAPHIYDLIAGPCREQFEKAVSVFNSWIAAGKIRAVDPKHLIFSLWATTQHYADFDVQVRANMGLPDPSAGDGRQPPSDQHLDEAKDFLLTLFLNGLRV